MNQQHVSEKKFLSMSYPNIMLLYFEKKIRCNWYSKVSFRASCEVQRCNMDSSVKIRVMDTAGRIKSTLKISLVIIK